ncbi:MAG: TolC family protein [Blastochloris sp.]|nr:TolC family protein [Blastochloris sp.]
MLLGLAMPGLLGSEVVRAAPPLPTKEGPAPVYSLVDCLELGLQRNPDVIRAQLEIERSQGLVITAKSLLYPKVGLAGRIEERNDDLFSEGSDARLQGFRDYWTVSLVVTQSLYSGGANRQQIAISKLQQSAALVQLRAVTNGVMRDIRQAVYEIVVQQAQIEAQEKTVQLLGEELVRQQQYFDAGKTTRFNVLRTQVSLSNQKTQLQDARVQRIRSQIALARLLNIEWSTQRRETAPFQVREELSCPPVMESLGELTAQALALRPELEVLQYQIEMGERQIKVDQASNIPRFDAFAGYELRRDQSESSFDSAVNNATVGLLGNWNIFDGFSGRGRVKSGQASLESARISLDSTRRQIQSEVRDAYERLKNAELTVQAQATNILTAEDSLRLSQNSADAGYATLLDVLQSTLDLTTARLEAIRARQRYMKALADLNYAISLTFQDPPSPVAAPASAPDLKPRSATP